MGRAYRGKIYPVSDAHPACDAMPWHTDKPDFGEMVEDMRANGFDKSQPIFRQLSTRLLINGRRRELSAMIAGVEPVYVDVEWGDAEIVAFVRRVDLQRRNLTPSERAAAAVELADLLGKGENQGTGGQFCPSANSAAAIAAEAGVSEKTVDAAAKVKKKAPELLPAVREGTLAAHVAAPVADLPAAERKEVLDAPDPKKAAKEKVKAKKKGKKSKSGASSPSGESSPDAAKDSPKAGESKGADPPKPGNPRPAPCAITAGTSKFYPRLVDVNGAEMVYDAYDQVVPAGTADYFCDTDLRSLYDEAVEVAAAAAALFDRAEELKRTAAAYPWTDYSQLSTASEKAQAGIAKMLDLIADSVPHAVCPDCHGHPATGAEPGVRRLCTTCRGTGFWPLRVCSERPDRLPKPARRAATA